MDNDRVERRLTAILAADVAGYSRLMGVDEEGTLALLKAHRRVLVDPKINEHRGRIVKTTGDGMLVEFASVVSAVRCAVDVQRGMAERNAEMPQDQRIEFRIGINVGDIIIDAGDIFGDGVNVAARLEGLADPGGICVSGRVHEDAQGKLDVGFEDIGEQRLKNIARPIRVYRLRLGGSETKAIARPAHALPDKPPIAILPFQTDVATPSIVHPLATVWSARLLPYFLAPVILLLLAHYLIIMKLDLDPIYLRLSAMVVPAICGFLLFRRIRLGIVAATLLGLGVSLVAVAGMITVVGLVDSHPILPTSIAEWQETVEYVVGVTLATAAGNLLARVHYLAVPSRLRLFLD